VKPPIDSKFVAYGGPNFAVDTEVRGEIVEAGGDLLIVPQNNYLHLCRPGNFRHPKPGEQVSWGNPPQSCYDQQREALIAARPVIKCELYAVGGRPDPSGGASAPPSVIEGGTPRPLRVGDTVRLRGLYVIDYSHPMYCDGFSTSFGSFMVWRGLYPTGYVHTEIHPYGYFGVELLDQLSPDQQLAENHTFVAPIYPEVYDSTYGWNKLWGVAGNMVDNAIETTETFSITVHGPLAPGAGYDRELVLTNVAQYGNPPVITKTPSGTTDMSVQVQISGSDIMNPSLFTATFAIAWMPLMNVTYTPNPLPLDMPVTVTFAARDARDGSALNGLPVLFNGNQVGVSGTPFSYRFQSQYKVVWISTNGTRHMIRVRVGPSIAVIVRQAGFEDFLLSGLNYAGVTPWIG